MTENEAPAAIGQDAGAGACTFCGQPNAEHCQQCWRCPGTSHDEMCGW